MTNYLLSKPDITVVNYLDSYLSEKIKRDGAINDDSMGRLLQMLALACRDGADGIISVSYTHLDVYKRQDLE